MSLALDPCGSILSRDTKHHHYGATPRSPTRFVPIAWSKDESSATVYQLCIPTSHIRASPRSPWSTPVGFFS